MPKARQAVVELAGREVVITNPDKLFFPQAGHTKLHLVRYYAGLCCTDQPAGEASPPHPLL